MFGADDLRHQNVYGRDRKLPPQDLSGPRHRDRPCDKRPNIPKQPPQEAPDARLCTCKTENRRQNLRDSSFRFDVSREGKDAAKQTVSDSASEAPSLFMLDKRKRKHQEEAEPSRNRSRKKAKKIRFSIPEKTLGYQDAKKAMWRSDQNGEREEECFDESNLRRNLDRFVRLKAIQSRYPTMSKNSLEIVQSFSSL